MQGFLESDRLVEDVDLVEVTVDMAVVTVEDFAVVDMIGTLCG